MPTPTKKIPDGNYGLNTPFDMDGMAAAGQKSMLTFAHLHSKLLRNTLEMNAEILDFVHKRVREDIRTNDALSRCDDVSQAAEVVSGFYQKAFEDYSDQTTKLMKLGTEVTRHSIEDVQAEIAEAQPKPE